MASLPPVQFQKPYRQPSLLEQVFARAASGLIERKLVTEPFFKKQVAAESEASATAFERSKELGDLAFERQKELLEREQDARRSADVFAGEMRMRDVENAEEFESSLSPDTAQLDVIREYTQEGGILGSMFTPEERARLTPRSRREAASTIDRFERMGQLYEMRRARQAQQAQAADDWLQRILPQVDQTVASLSPMLVKGEDGELRFPTDEEQRLRAFGGAISAGELLGHENDPRIARARQGLTALEGRLVPLPAYDPDAEAQVLGSLDKPDSTGRSRFTSFANALRSARFLGGNDDEGFWFIDDRGERVDVRNESELISKLPQMARERLRGVVWTEFFNLRDDNRFKAAQTAYDLTSPAAVATRAALLGLPQEPSATRSERSDGGGTSRLGLALEREQERRRDRQGPTLTSDAAAAAVREGSRKDREQLDYYAKQMLDDPEYYDTEAANIASIAALEPEAFRRVLADMWPEYYGPTAEEATGRYALPARRVPPPERWKFEMLRALNLAQLEATARRRQEQQAPTPQ